MLDRLDDLVATKTQRFFEDFKVKTRKEEYEQNIKKLIDSFFHEYVKMIHPIFKKDIVLAYWIYWTRYFSSDSLQKKFLRKNISNDEQNVGGYLDIDPYYSGYKDKIEEWKNNYSKKVKEIDFDFKELVFEFKGEKTPIEFEKKEAEEFKDFIQKLDVTDVQEFTEIVIFNYDKLDDAEKKKYVSYIKESLRQIQSEFFVGNQDEIVKNIDDKIACEAAKYFSLFCQDGLDKTPYKYIYYIPSLTYDGNSFGGFSLFCKNQWPRTVTKVFQRCATRFGTAFSEIERILSVKEHALKAAIAAIMSRNMSHNIGSHVLINLEKNGNGTDVDDIKYFLSYLRTRMDFLAQISTEWPSWSLPTRFLQDLMYDYFQQICLLRYIGASENLDHKKLKVFFHFEDGQVLGPFEAGENEKLRKTLLKNDILISVVGGITGRQAFYIMLENIIRNAAKHSYSGIGDLEIHINIKAEKNEYRIEIWDNVSKIKNGLLDEINNAIEQPIITEIGEVQKGNWGIAEMKISAAYLQKFDYQLLGQADGHNKKIIKAETTHDGFLKYVFHIPRPKEVVIVDMHGKKEQLPDSSIVSRKTIDEFALMDTKDTDYEFMVLFPDVVSREDVLKKLADNKGILLERLPTRLFWVGDKTAFNKATDSRPYMRKRIAVLELDTKALTKKIESDEFGLWLYAQWIKHIRDNVRGDDIVKGKRFHLYLKLTETEETNQYNSDYIKDYYSYFIPPLVQDSNNFDSDTKDQWRRLKDTIKSKDDSILSEIIEDILMRENVPEDGLPVIAYPRHGPTKNAELKNLVSNKRLIYAEELSGASPHFNILASPPTDDYQLKKLALWLIEGGLLRIAIADERIGKEIRNDLKELSIINIAKLIKNGDMKTPVSVSSAGQYINISDEYPYVSKIASKTKNTPLIADVLVIHQGVIDKMVNAKFWDSMDDAENWILGLKEQVPFIIVTSGRGKPDEIPDGVKYVPFSDISQSFAGRHSTNFLLTYILMHARE